MQENLLDIYFGLKQDFNFIKTTYNLLNKTSELKIATHSAGQWLLDNMYIIEQEFNTAKEALTYSTEVGLPLVRNESGKTSLRVMFMAEEMITRNSGIIDDGIFSNYVKNFQKHTYVTYAELATLPIMLRIAEIKFIKRICVNIFNSEMQKLKVEKRLNKSISRYADKITDNAIKKLGSLKSDLTFTNKIKTSNTSYIEYMAFRLKDMGVKGIDYLKDLKEETNIVGFTIDEAIEKEHEEIAKTTSLISNAIMTMKAIGNTNWGEVIVNINRIDEALLEDYTGEYAKCDHKTKSRYRDMVIHLARKYNVSEMYVAKKVVESSKKYEKHVGHFLIGEDKNLLLKEMGKSTASLDFYRKIIRPLKPYMYILAIIAIAATCTLVFDRFIVNKIGNKFEIIFDIIVFMFGMELADKIIAYFVSKFVRPKSLPRFNFAKTIDKETSTMIAMPTIINSVEKLEKMAKKMEITYLANRSENMYYMLVGDCTSADKTHIDLDDKIIEKGQELINKLNEKYPNNPKLFNFLYRKRVYSKGEGLYMGWERKRGALTELNLLLLNKLTEEEINSKMTLVNKDLPEIKYVITIDEDTSLSLNSAKELVAIIAHPLNKAVLSKNGKTVKSGYGLIQPAIGLDIESANSSIFSKVFGGFGGLDIYTNAISNLYQDVFHEAIYTGKGIYDVELFDKLIGNKVPENLILSHDLLEGSFLRTGLASDVEVQDGFPSNFIAYTKRNHRWFRGDMQIVSWILNPFSGLNLLSRWKIFDNLRRETLDIWALVLLIITMFIPGKSFMWAIISVFVILNFGYILSTIDQLIFGKNVERKQKQYIPVIYGIRANFLKMVFNIITIPYRAYVVLNAFLTSLYRMIISKKKLLEWTTAENIEKSAKEKLSYVYKNMWPNIIIGIAVIIYSIVDDLYIFKNAFILSMGIFFLIAPLAAYIMSKKVIFEKARDLDKKEKQEIVEIGRATWKYFDSTMTEINNFLPPDNYQENRRPKFVSRTSSTNIGFGILSIIDAYDLEYITVEAVIEKLSNIINTVYSLDKWHGHLYNWYNIRTKEPLRPRFVSTVDSGNFVASLYVTKTFLQKLLNSKIVIAKLKDEANNILVKVNELIEGVDFSKLYAKTKNIFSIGFDVESGKLVDSYYDMLMSESRLTSLISIATSQITSKHWFALARNLVKIDNIKGLLSWSGTSFEYFMPNLFTNTYKYTLIDESLNFALTSQIKYAKLQNVPWGVSESAFAVQDNEQNYQYKAFGIPWLGLKRGLNDNLVISPYSSLMCLDYAPKKVYSNVKKLKALNAYSNFGFYEAIDYTKNHIGKGKKYEVVKTYMAHHQGMILTAINNYINQDIVKERFHENPAINAADILLKERIPLSVPLKENKNSSENKFIEPSKDSFTSFVSYIPYDEIKSDDKDTKTVNIHSNGKLTVIQTETGTNYMYYLNNAISKNRFKSNEKTLGNTMIFKDKSTGKVWSYAYEPMLIKPDEYNVSFSLAKSEYFRKDGDIETKTVITVAPEYNMEIRKCTLQNYGKERKEIVIYTELELAMAEEKANIVHPAFNNLLVEEFFDENLDALIAVKRSKEIEKEDYYVYSKLVGIDLDYEIETEKYKISNDSEDAYNEEITRYPLWPIMSYRARILLNPGEIQTFYYIVGTGKTKYDISHQIVNSDMKTLDAEIEFASQKENITAKYLKLVPGKAECYNKVLSAVLFGNKNENSNVEELWNLKLDQSMLWKFGISGDIPIVTVHIGKIEDSAMLTEVISFMDYAKSRKVDLDIVILVDEESYSGEPIKAHIEKVLEHVMYISYTRGRIFVVNINDMSYEEKKLFDFVSVLNIQNIDELMPSDKFNTQEKKIFEEEE